MKFFHVGDLHFGKMLHNVDLVETDQAYWVDQFLKAVDRYQPDAVVVAGDVYDRRIPSPEAMKLFDHFLTELANRGKYVFVIPGNHDSSIRLSHVNELLEAHHIYIAGELERELMHVTVSDESADVTFWLMPYIFPKLVSQERVLNREDLSTYSAAAEALLAAQDLDENACNVLIAHQNVLAGSEAPEHSDSETIIGGLGEIECSVFDRFDYVALGHIHNAQKIGRETVRYSGCPLYYDFSEIDRDKRLTMVTVNGKDDISIERIEIPLLHRLIQQTGTLEELLAAGREIEDKGSYYFQCVLRDRVVPERATEQLRAVYGNQLIHVKRDFSDSYSAESRPTVSARAPRLSILELFTRFYQELNQGELPDGTQEALLNRVLEQQARRGDDYILNQQSIPEEDSRELLDDLLRATEEEHA